jgi:hypothetical protein
MPEGFQEGERRALIVNDIYALASQLNERLERAAEWGLEVEVEARRGLKMKEGRALGVTALSVRVLAEAR